MWNKKVTFSVNDNLQKFNSVLSVGVGCNIEIITGGKGLGIESADCYCSCCKAIVKISSRILCADTVQTHSRKTNSYGR